MNTNDAPTCYGLDETKHHVARRYQRAWDQTENAPQRPLPVADIILFPMGELIPFPMATEKRPLAA